MVANLLSQAQIDLRDNIAGNYPAIFSTSGTFGTNDQTIGASATYGALGVNSAVNGAIPITAKDASGGTLSNGVLGPRGNYLFGNFRQNGTRDFAAVKESLNAALSLHAAERLADGDANANNSIFTADGGVTNGTAITPLNSSGGTTWGATANTKGDLVVLGDYNSDGRFDGKDIQQLARGASLADSASTDQLTTASGATFADQVRNPNAVLRKNAALDFVKSATADTANLDQAFLRRTARAVLTTDPGVAPPSGAVQLSSTGSGATLVTTYTLDSTGANSFNKFDVTRDGVVDRNDFQVVEYFEGKDYHNLDDQLGSVLRVTATGVAIAFVDAQGNKLDPSAVANAAIARKAFSLVDAELDDNGAITHILSGGTSDAKLIHDELVALGKLPNGDSNLDGIVNIDDLSLLAQNYNLTSLDSAQSAGTSSFSADFRVAFGAPSGVPEPGTISLFGLASVGLLARRRRRTAR